MSDKNYSSSSGFGSTYMYKTSYGLSNSSENGSFMFNFVLKLIKKEKRRLIMKESSITMLLETSKF